MAASRLEGGVELETGAGVCVCVPASAGAALCSFSADAGRAAALPILPSLVLVLPLPLPLPSLIVLDIITLSQTITVLEWLGEKSTSEDSAAFPRGGWCPSPAAGVLLYLSRRFRWFFRSCP